MSEPLLLQAFQGTNDNVPVWFMRQAGRYLPQYRAIKEKYSLLQMFQTPEIACEITCQPVELLNVDAAIIFADILTLPGQMGFEISFETGGGPVILNPIKKQNDLNAIHDFIDLSFVRKTIQLCRKKLPAHIPIIGFAGSPFTVLCYLVEGGSSHNFNKTLKFIFEETEIFHRLMKILTQNTIQYLNLQKEAGIAVFQLFDTWGGILPGRDYREFVLPYINEIFSQVDLPSIYYLKNSNHLLNLMPQTRSDFLSICHTLEIDDPKISDLKMGIQGNLYNALLYADVNVLGKNVDDILHRSLVHPKFIFNLSHGIFPDIDVEKVRFVVDRVHAFAGRKNQERVLDPKG